MAAADHRLLRERAKEIAALGEADGDKTVVAWGEYFAGIALIYNNEGGAANRLLRRALAAFREQGERVMAARTMINLAMIEADINLNPSEARRLYEEATPAIREEGDVSRLAILHGNLGEICRLEGDYAAALRHARDSERLFREAGDLGRVVWQLVDIAHYHCLRREYPAAVESMREAYRTLQQESNPRWVAWYFDVWVIIAAKLERWEVVAQLLGYVDRMRSEQNVPRLQLLLPWLSSPMERLASMIPEDRLHELFEAGEALTIEQAEAVASSVSP
jgi:tetratricopeptide (TPR) repeat protein